MAKRPPSSPLPLDRALESLLWASLHRSRSAILNGLVVVNGTVETNPSRIVQPATDEIDVAGEPLTIGASATATVIVHKPAGMPVEPTIDEIDLYDLLPIRDGWSAPCGTLTRQGAGLVLLTNDPDHADAEASAWSVLSEDQEEREGVRQRVRLGPFRIDDLEGGSWQRLTGDQVAALDAMVSAGIDHRTPLDQVWEEIVRAAREHERGG